MRKIFLPLLLLSALAGCRTTEANYRAAYEKAKAHRDSWNGIDGTVYDEIRRQSRPSTIQIDGHEIPAMKATVKLVDSADGEHPAGRYVVVAQFKQLFNARSMCKRLRESGYEDATLLVTAEPLYYVAAASSASDSELAATYQRLKYSSPMTFSEPYPLILIPAK